MKTSIDIFVIARETIPAPLRHPFGSPLRKGALLGAFLVSFTCANAVDLVWIGGTGNWNAGANWSPAQVPTAADNVNITNAGTYTVTIPAGVTAAAGAIMVGGPGGTQTLAIDRATLTVGGASVISANGELDFLVAQSVFTGPGNLQVDGTLNWANGTMSGGAATTIGAGGTLVIGSAGVTLGRTLNNGGTASWSGGNLALSPGAGFNNLPGGAFDIIADGRISGSASTPVNNSGLFRQIAGTTGTVITAPFNNSGTLVVLSSTLNLNLGGTHTGTANIGAGATLNFGGGGHVLAGGSLVTGAGVLGVSGGATTLTAAGTFDVAGSVLSVLAGAVTFAPTCVLTGTTVGISGATSVVNFNGSGTVAVVNLTGGILGGTSPVVVTGLLTLAGGAVTNALVTALGGMNINGGTTLNGGRVVNVGTAIWSAGNFIGANGAVFSNLLGATFINTFDGNAASGAGATPVFVNAGTFQKTDGTAPGGTTSIDFQFINTGTVEVRTNTLRYAANQQSAGLTLLDGGGLSAQAQPVQLSGGSLAGTGLVTVANNQNLINSAAVSPGAPLGELDIAGNYQQTASGVLNIELGGYVAGTNFDLITVSAGGAGGVATLGGSLNATLAGGFSPTNGATFTFLTALSRLGSFATFNYPSNDIGLRVDYTPTSATLKVTNLKPFVANPILDPAPVTYGSAFNFQFPAGTFADPDNDTLSYSASGMPPGITFSGSTRTFSGTPTQAGVFAVSVVANDGGSPNLTATNTFQITVSPAALTVVADALTKTYGAPDPGLTFAVNGLLFADTPAAVLTGALARGAGETVTSGPYPITQGTLTANGNYSIDFTPDLLTIVPAPLSVTATAATKTYGSVDPAFSAGYTGFVNGETPAVLGGTLTFARAPGESVGGHPVTPGGLTSGNYAISFNPGTLTISRAALSVTAGNQTKIYGTADPVFTVSYTGLVNGDSPAALGGTLAFTRASGESAGGYPVTPGGLTSGNYAITFNPGTLIITKAALSVTPNAQTKVYGAADPVFTLSYAGFVNGDASAVLGGTPAVTRAPGEIVGTYVTTPSGLTSGNYAITFLPGTLSVTKAALSVIADAGTKIYGAPETSLTYVVSGLQFNDTAATALTGALARAAGETVAGGPYLITQGTLTPNGNYTIDFTGNTFSIIRAPLSSSADDAFKTYGTPDPAFTVTYAGLVNGDTSAVLEGTLAFARVPGENVGSYLITPGGVTNGNYAITFNPGTLTINRAALSVTADARSKTYGAAEPAFTASYGGFVNGETPAVLGGTLSFVRSPGENAGSYLITPGGVTNGNYAITFNPGTLTITPAALSVAAAARTKTYGAADPALTYAVSGLQFSDTAASVLTGALTRTPGETVAGGPYAITQGGLAANGNYSINFTGSALIVTKAPLSVAAAAKSKTYGAVDPAFSVVFTGFVNGETPAVLGGTPTLTRLPGENVGSYPISPGGLTSGNYAISFKPGTLTIGKAVLSVTASPVTKTYGATDPALTFAITGLKFNETASTAIPGVLTRVAGESVAGGPYPITQGTLTPSSNYTLSFTGSAFTIAPASLTVTADAKTKVYGAGDPAFTVSYTGFVFGETSAVLGGTVSLARDPGENAGDYLITPGGLTSGNYALKFTGGLLTITRAPLSVNANAVTKTYGAADPALTFSVNGLRFNDTAQAVLTGALSRVPGESVADGPYAALQGTLTANGNYTLGFTGNTLTITRAALSVTTVSATKAGGTADPAFTAAYTGLVNGETPAVLGGILAFTRAPGEDVGTYPVTPGGLTSGNYAITFDVGTLTIVAPAPVMLPLSRLDAASLMITWTSAGNAVYRVQYTSDLGAAVWTDLVGDVTATGTTASKTDLLTTSNRFYRVLVLP